MLPLLADEFKRSMVVVIKNSAGRNDFDSIAVSGH
jgi:hypothetical protein